jgi:hypothetical protein
MPRKPKFLFTNPKSRNIMQVLGLWLFSPLSKLEGERPFIEK